MSGTCSFMLRSVLETIGVQLGEVSCVHFDYERMYIYLGMHSGEIVALQVKDTAGTLTIHPKLFLSPSFAQDTSQVVAMTVAEMPFSLMTVNQTNTGQLSVCFGHNPRGW